MKKVIITGATSGIGREFAYLLLNRGWQVYITGRNEIKCRHVIHELEEQTGAQCAGYCDADLSQEDDIVKLSKFTETVRPDMFINNAGFGLSGEMLELDNAEMMNMIQVNEKALTMLSGTATRVMKEKGGTIINVASLAAFGPNPYSAVYGATKAYVLSYSMALAKEVSKYGITVTSLCPGPTKTLFAEKSNMGKTSVFDGHVMSARRVAECGLRAAKKGKLYVVAGRANSLLARLEKISPSRLVLSIAASKLSFKK